MNIAQGVAAAFLALLSGCAATQAIPDQQKIELAERLRNRIVVGMPSAEVESVLESEGVEFSYVLAEELLPVTLHFERRDLAVLDGQYMSIIRDVKKGFIHEDISIQVDIDRSKTVSHVEVKSILTGP